jgi:hypothetical protein
MQKRSFLLILALALLLVILGISIRGGGDPLSRWLASLHGRPSH